MRLINIINKGYIKFKYDLGLFNEEESYQKKEQIYEAKIILQSGEELNFGQGCYEPKLKQNSATWENAKHKVIQNFSKEMM